VVVVCVIVTDVVGGVDRVFGITVCGVFIFCVVDTVGVGVVVIMVDDHRDVAVVVGVCGVTVVVYCTIVIVVIC